MVVHLHTRHPRSGACDMGVSARESRKRENFVNEVEPIQERVMRNATTNWNLSMRVEECPPSGYLLSSMRAVGYSLQTAIADLVDNSIAAGASTIDVHFNGAAEEPYVAVLDNGRGMVLDEARSAMRLAGINANDEREAADLGRFGLGLKTASLSQCRSLTLVTKKGNEVSALTWDLDVIEQSGSWSLQVHDLVEVERLPHMGELAALNSGTLVLWAKLDRLLDHELDKGRFLDAEMEHVRTHLSLVFHRFLDGEDHHGRVQLRMNYVEVVGMDPFLTKAKKTQRGPIEVLRVSDSAVTIQSFTLPFLNEMTSAEKSVATAAGALRDSQGFYIYRARRLVVWGTWFRLYRKSDLGRLTRVRVDIPNSLDHLWSLDIKKSSAVPPTVVRHRLKELAQRFVDPSERVHKYRGRPAANDPLTRVWDVIEERGAARYQLNRQHPLLQSVADALSVSGTTSLERLLECVEASLPVQDIFNRMSGDTAVDQSDSDAVLDGLMAMWDAYIEKPDASHFFDRMSRVEPFNSLSARRDEVLKQLDARGARGNTA